MKNSVADIYRPTNFLKKNNNICPKCNGTGYELIEIATDKSREVYGDDSKTEYAVPCSYCNGGHAERVQEAKERANIPSSFYDSRLSNFNWNIYQDNQGKTIDLDKQRRIVQSFIEQFETWEKKGIGLYIFSYMRGSGKTFLASCICNDLIALYPMNTKFVSASKLIDIQKSGTATGTEYDRDPIGLLCKCKLLVIDDLGQKQSANEWTNDILFRILDERMQAKKVTVITSNIPIQELQLDDRIVDRINRICHPIALPEFCVRSREAKNTQVELFRELGLIQGKKVI